MRAGGADTLRDTRATGALSRLGGDVARDDHGKKNEQADAVDLEIVFPGTRCNRGEAGIEPPLVKGEVGASDTGGIDEAKREHDEVPRGLSDVVARRVLNRIRQRRKQQHAQHDKEHVANPAGAHPAP